MRCARGGPERCGCGPPEEPRAPALTGRPSRRRQLALPRCVLLHIARLPPPGSCLAPTAQSLKPEAMHCACQYGVAGRGSVRAPAPLSQWAGHDAFLSQSFSPPGWRPACFGRAIPILQTESESARCSMGFPGIGKQCDLTDWGARRERVTGVPGQACRPCRPLPGGSARREAGCGAWRASGRRPRLRGGRARSWERPAC